MIDEHKATIQQLNSDLKLKELISDLETQKLELEADSSTKNQTIRELEAQILALLVLLSNYSTL